MTYICIEANIKAHKQTSDAKIVIAKAVIYRVERKIWRLNMLNIRLTNSNVNKILIFDANL